ncbi:TldD/PmbA family protein [Sporosarcina thermotolerans]|uniref:TldD/PmbA family protein n=1 Tax=Sporosarcina thermotolerans TaxID=633404 RepID=A0AAW9ADA2_9BACL|nr:TldD/PmbA family protein [Sporosarcina thermotolerans]MDW0118045.1 TldD/PmbA family protein [Sporosarcina thermotolerans]
MSIEQLKERLFAEGQNIGFTDLELYYEKRESLSIGLYEGEVDKYDFSDVQGASVRGLYNGKTGYAYTEKFDEESVSFLLKNAAENAELIENEPEELFTEEAEYAETQFYSPELDAVKPEDMIGFLQEVEKKILSYDHRVTKVTSSQMRYQRSEKGLYHDKGLELREANNSLFFYVSIFVEENGELKSGSVFRITKDFNELDADAIVKEVVEQGLSMLGERNYPNKKYPVVLKNKAAASLLATFTSSFSAQAVQDNRSRLKGKLGEKIAADHVNLIDNPFLPEGIQSSTFDSEGVPTRKLSIVEEGNLQTYFHNLKTAKKDGVETTGHAHRSSYKGSVEVSPSNFYIEPAPQTYEQLYGEFDEGIIITGLAGLHSGAHPISGDFSLAADGYYVKDGKIVGPTKQMTVAGNFFEVLQDIEEIGSDLIFSPMGSSGYIGSPSLKIKSLAVTVD